MVGLWSFSGTMNLQYAKHWKSAPVYRVHDLIVTEGVNVGQTILDADDMCLGDVYRFGKDARSYQLNAFETPEGRLVVSESTMLGAPGYNLHFDCCLLFVSETGIGLQVCLIIETDSEGHIADLYYLPRSPVSAKLSYELIKIERTSPSGPGLPALDQSIADGFAAVGASNTATDIPAQPGQSPTTPAKQSGAKQSGQVPDNG